MTISREDAIWNVSNTLAEVFDIGTNPNARGEAERVIEGLERLGIMFFDRPRSTVESIPIAFNPQTTEIVEWRRIKQYTGYEISRDGVIRDRFNKKEKSTRGGMVTLQKGMARRNLSVAKLLEEAYPHG